MNAQALSFARPGDRLFSACARRTGHVAQTRSKASKVSGDGMVIGRNTRIVESGVKIQKGDKKASADRGGEARGRKWELL